VTTGVKRNEDPITDLDERLERRGFVGGGNKQYIHRMRVHNLERVWDSLYIYRRWNDSNMGHAKVNGGV